MTPRELRRAMRQQRKELRRAMPGLRRRAREQAERRPVVQKEKRRRRTRRTLLLALILLLLLLLRCDCQPAPAPPPPPKVEAVPEPPPKPKPPKPAPKKLKPIRAKTEPQKRGGFSGESRPAPSWLDDFRLQVAARSRRLAECFTGNDKPGAMRWTTSVNPESGAVADHEIEPLGPVDELSNRQRECVLEVLSNPAYRLGDSQKQGLPDRISLVIEF